jgi:hypothetical protein
MTNVAATTTAAGKVTTATTPIIAGAIIAILELLVRKLLLLHLRMNSVGLRHIISAKARGVPKLRAHTIRESIWIEFILASIPHIVL